MRQRRWLELLKDYNLTISYLPGKANVVADALSRESKFNLAALITSQKSISEDMRRAEMKIRKLDEGKESEFPVHQDGTLRFGHRICVPDNAELKREIMKEAHSTSYSVHPGSTKMCMDLKVIKPVSAFEALYGRKWRSHICWDDVGERKLLHPELVQQTVDIVQVIRERFHAAQSRQKSYADNRRRELKFEVGDNVLLKVSPTKGVMRFGVKGKLSPRFVVPYEILEKIGKVAYRLALATILVGSLECIPSLDVTKVYRRPQSCH
ncbi:uncharacterized protein LOC143850291 [Tasmannia lanceolata]|uniref:uncharacterized protein LOC143850291 n=1 Tax=Tasmannia lanceolata TaxID=3420 RepID=UPI0040644020